MTIVNKNVDFIDTRSFALFYIISIATLRYLFYLTPLKTGWTGVAFFHALISFIMLHWNKGTASHDDQGRYSHLTFWEQIDAGTQFTSTRKFMTIVPIIIFLLSMYESHWEPAYLVFNTLVLAPLLIAKMPEMNRVRIFGINK